MNIYCAHFTTLFWVMLIPRPSHITVLTSSFVSPRNISSPEPWSPASDLQTPQKSDSRRPIFQGPWLLSGSSYQPISCLILWTSNILPLPTSLPPPLSFLSLFFFSFAGFFCVSIYLKEPLSVFKMHLTAHHCPLIGTHSWPVSLFFFLPCRWDGGVLRALGPQSFTLLEWHPRGWV